MVISKLFFILTNVALFFHDDGGGRCQGFTPTEKDAYENENEKENNENENTYDNAPSPTEDGGDQRSYTQEDSYEAADNYDNTEPFDPEKSGFLIHEYFDRAYEKHPDYDTATMKLNLNYFGDVLIDKTKDDVIDDVTYGEMFTLDPEESKTIIKEQPEEETSDLRERENDPDDNDKDDDNDEDDEKIEPDTDNYTDKKQVEEKDGEVDWIDNVGYESLT